MAIKAAVVLLKWVGVLLVQRDGLSRFNGKLISLSATSTTLLLQTLALFAVGEHITFLDALL